MQAFNNDPALKDNLLKEIKWHQDQDKIQHGHYGEHYALDDTAFKGCAVGCSIRSLYKIGKVNSTTANWLDGNHLTSSHRVYEEILGIPRNLALLEDVLFEGVKDGSDLLWPERFMRAIPVGADLSNVFSNVIHRAYQEAHRISKEETCKRLASGKSYASKMLASPHVHRWDVDMVVSSLERKNISPKRIMNILIEELQNASVQQ